MRRAEADEGLKVLVKVLRVIVRSMLIDLLGRFDLCDEKMELVGVPAGEVI